MSSLLSVLPPGRVITVINGKGGVGKTTLSVHVAEGLAELGLRTLLLDVDPQGSALWWDEAPDDPALALRTEFTRAHSIAELVRLLPELRGLYDVAVVDTAPTLTASSLRPVMDLANLVLVPTAPDVMLELKATLETMKIVERLGIPSFVVLTRVDGRAQVETIRTVKTLRSMGLPVATSQLRALKAYRTGANEQTVAWRSSHPSGPQAHKDVQALVQEVLASLCSGFTKRERRTTRGA